MSVSSPRFTRNGRLVKASENKPPMKQGEKGEAVAIVQDAFIDLGFALPISTANGRKLADGVYGPETAKTARNFQAAFGLTVDGVVGRQTLQKLSDLITDLVTAQKTSVALETAFPRGRRPANERTLRRIL